MWRVAGRSARPSPVRTCSSPLTPRLTDRVSLEPPRLHFLFWENERIGTDGLQGISEILDPQPMNSCLSRALSAFPGALRGDFSYSTTLQKGLFLEGWLGTPSAALSACQLS